MKKTLLLVDDEAMLLRSLKRIFEDDDYEILTADNAQDGLKLLSEQKIQVIICDQRMPHMTGSEFFTRVKKEYPDTIRIILSGYADFEALKNAINEGDIYKFMTKPWDNKSLHDMVKDAFDLYEHQNKSKDTIKKETQEELKRLQDEFLSNISHEIRTPLNGIIGFSELLNNGVVDPLSPEHKEYLGDILASSQLLSKLLTNALDLVQANAETINFNPVTVDLQKLISEVVDSTKIDLENKKITINIKVDELPTPIVLDPERFKQALSHYITNAVKFTNMGGNITVNAKAESQSSFRVSVTDDGIGIDQKDLDKLFKPFQQVEMGAGKMHQGAGLGLALVKRIIELQGGQVGVKSAIGKGSVFYIVLPAIPAN